LVIIGLFVLFNFVSVEGLRYQKVLTVPLFTIAWGLIGCATYISYTTYIKVKDKVFDWYDLSPYLFRFVLAVFFTAFTYVVTINGLITLPGTVGKEVKASIEAKEIGPEPGEVAFGTPRNDNEKEKEPTLTRNSLYNITKNVGGLIVEVGGTAPAYASTIKTGIVATNGRDEPEGYTPRRDADERRLSVEMLEGIKDTVGVTEKPKRPDEIAEEIRIIDEDLTDIGKETEGVKHEISKIIAEPGEEGIEGGYKEKEIREKIEALEEISAEAGRTEALKVAKEAELGVALEREKQPPVWESWIFILVAFISGFSVEFGAGLIERFRELFLSTAGRKPG
jgi:hypothetical protein